MKELFIQYAMPPILTAIGLGAAWALTQLGLWASSKWKDSKVSAVVSRVTHFAGVVVQDLEATMRPELAKAAEDGHLSPEEGRHIKKVALDRLKSLLGEKGLGELKSLLGVFAPTLDQYLSGVIERQVAALPSPK